MKHQPAEKFPTRVSFNRDPHLFLGNVLGGNVHASLVLQITAFGLLTFS